MGDCQTEESTRTDHFQPRSSPFPHLNNFTEAPNTGSWLNWMNSQFFKTSRSLLPMASSCMVSQCFDQLVLVRKGTHRRPYQKRRFHGSPDPKVCPCLSLCEVSISDLLYCKLAWDSLLLRSPMKWVTCQHVHIIVS